MTEGHDGMSEERCRELARHVNAKVPVPQLIEELSEFLKSKGLKPLRTGAGWNRISVLHIDIDALIGDDPRLDPAQKPSEQPAFKPSDLRGPFC